MKAFHCMSHLPEVFASRDREKAYYIAGVLVIRGPSYAKFFCLNRVSKFKGPRKSVLIAGVLVIRCITYREYTVVKDEERKEVESTNLYKVKKIKH